MKVREVFSAGGRLTIVVGTVVEPVPRIGQVDAQVLLDGRVVGTVLVSAERMPGPGCERNLRSLETTDSHQWHQELVTSGRYELRW